MEAILGELEEIFRHRPSGEGQPPAGSERRAVDRLLKRYPKAHGETFSKSDLLAGLRLRERRAGRDPEASPLFPRLRKKPLRTASGVATLTVLTRPHPCPGRCVFCPSDVRMPKSYLSSEPGSQRAEQHGFDPYLQTTARLRALTSLGHPVDKVEIIVLGGTWTAYPGAYRRWFALRLFQALNDFDPAAPVEVAPRPAPSLAPELPAPGESYNRAVRRRSRRGEDASENASWTRVEAAQGANEGAHCRCVGLSFETRPDRLEPADALELRRLGATKVQIGIQSTSDAVLGANRRGHDLAATRRALSRLRRLGFKIHAHWMPNLLGSTPELDRQDYARLWSDPALKPDELKVYPCSLVAGTELEEHHRRGAWRPYEEEELLDLLVHCLESAPPWTRLTRVVRDIPSHDILVGNKKTNFRQLAEGELARRGGRGADIRAREIRRRPLDDEAPRLEVLEYPTATGREVFFQAVTRDDRLCGFLRLALPSLSSIGTPGIPEELYGSALIREVHVYGPVAPLGRKRRHGRAQHGGLGRRLVAAAEARARSEGYAHLAVISAVGTRRYYRRLGFTAGELYQHRALAAAPPQK